MGMHSTRRDASGGFWCAQCGVSWDYDDEPPAQCNPLPSASRRRKHRHNSQDAYKREMDRINKSLGR